MVRMKAFFTTSLAVEVAVDCPKVGTAVVSKESRQTVRKAAPKRNRRDIIRHTSSGFCPGILTRPEKALWRKTRRVPQPAPACRGVSLLRPGIPETNASWTPYDVTKG